METNSETRLIKGLMLSLSFFFLPVAVLVFACACTSRMHTHVTAPRNCGCGIRHSTVPPERRFAKVSTRPADFASADQHAL